MNSISLNAVFFSLFLLAAGALVSECFARTDNKTGVEEQFRIQREQMVADQLRMRDISDRKVLEAMLKVPRHEFVPESLRDSAYDDNPLPIGYGQTISQPYIVAYMTQLLQVGPGDKVLEIGTGSGYQAAILSCLTDDVYSVEIIPALAQDAARRLKRLGDERIHLKEGDGYYGWEENAPYDAIMVTAAATHVPPPLLRQLKDGGRMVIPVGSTFFIQTLMLVTKEGGKIKTTSLIGVSFVPLTGKH